MDRAEHDAARRWGRWCMVLSLALVCAGCGVARTDLMDYRPSPGFDVQPPPPGRSLVIFTRADREASETSAALFEDETLIGILMARTYLAYETTPGKHRFMVVSEAADFMDADLVDGKVYFARVDPREGWWRARFSLRPVTPNDPRWAEVREWNAASTRVTLNNAGRGWAQENAASIAEKHDAYLVKWLGKNERPTLYREDGIAFTDIP